jgi:Flp pilus assembly protein TadD
MIRKWFAAATVAVAALGLAAPASAAWRKAETANFILYAEAGEAELRERAAQLEDYHSFLRLLTGVTDAPAANKLRVYVVSGDEMRLARDLPAAVSGFYGAGSAGIAAFINTSSPADETETLFHEIAHHFMMQYRPGAYPAWFVEGFAEYVASAKLKGKTIDFGQPGTNRAQMLSRVRWLKVEDVLFERSSGRPIDRAMYYAQSWLLAHYMMRDEGRREKFKAYVTALGTGTPPREAFAAQFGDLKTFSRAVETYATRQLTYSRLTRSSTAAAPEVRVETLPASADKLLPLDAALYMGQRDKWAASALASVRAEAAKHPGDAYARRVLAMAEVLHGDGAKGEALLDELLKASPQDGELLYLKGMRHLIAARASDENPRELFSQARTWFARAHKADPHHWRALGRYAESLSGDPRYNSENTMEIVLLAHELAPQVVELRINAARLLMLRGRHGEAEQLLLPLAFDPHREGLAAEARKLLAQARAGSKPVPAPSASPSGE